MRASEERPVMAGLQPSFEVFNTHVRSFLMAKSIATPKALLKHKHLGEACMDWRMGRIGNKTILH